MLPSSGVFAGRGGTRGEWQVILKQMLRLCLSSVHFRAEKYSSVISLTGDRTQIQAHQHNSRESIILFHHIGEILDCKSCTPNDTSDSKSAQKRTCWNECEADKRMNMPS